MKDRIISYFLGDLSKEEEILLEEEYFASEEKFLEFEVTQNDLIDAYVENQLSSLQKEKFENYLKATPGICKKVEIAKALSIHIAALPKTTPQIEKNTSNPNISWWQKLKEAFASFNLAWRFAFASSLAIAFLALTWRYVEQERLKQLLEKQQELLAEKNQYTQQLKELQEQNQSQQTKALELEKELEKEKTKQLKLEEELAQLSKQKNQTKTFSSPFVLGYLQTRDENSKEKILNLKSENNKTIQFELQLPKTLLKPTQIKLIATGEEEQFTVWQDSNIENSSRQINGYLVIELPSNALNSYSYTLELNGKTKDGNIDLIQSYQFSVIKK